MFTTIDQVNVYPTPLINKILSNFFNDKKAQMTLIFAMKTK